MPDQFISDSLFELNITLLRDRKTIAQPCGFIKVRTTCFPGLCSPYSIVVYNPGLE